MPLVLENVLAKIGISTCRDSLGPSFFIWATGKLLGTATL